jgi:hypothetical protein
MDNIYEGFPTDIAEGGRLVLLNGETLLPKRSREVVDHSPDGFSWGYDGSGPAQLALAIFLEEFPTGYDVSEYQEFKRDVISRWDTEAGWILTSRDLDAWMKGRPA